MTGMPRSRAAARIGSISAVWPYRWTGMMAEVLGKGLLERLDLRTLREHPGRQDLPHSGEFFVAEDRAGDGDRDHRTAEPAPEYEGSLVTCAAANDEPEPSASARGIACRRGRIACCGLAGDRIRTPTR